MSCPWWPVNVLTRTYVHRLHIFHFTREITVYRLERIALYNANTYSSLCLHVKLVKYMYIIKRASKCWIWEGGWWNIESRLLRFIVLDTMEQPLQPLQPPPKPRININYSNSGAFSILLCIVNVIRTVFNALIGFSLFIFLSSLFPKNFKLTQKSSRLVM